MLTNTFCHIRGVGPKTERKLWAAGVNSWHEALECDRLPLSTAKSDRVARSAERSIGELNRGNAGFFYDGLPSAEQWRMFPEFRYSAAYLDIETTGLGGPYDHVTTVALYDGERLRHYVYEENLDEFREDIGAYDVVVTYNGKQFDVPFLREHLGVRVDQPHIDLRYVLASLGHKGGLKSCERQIGIDRGELDGVDGFFAVLLWRDFRRNANRRALETLLAYNIADTVTLERLMVHAYNAKIDRTPLEGTAALPGPRPPENPFRPDPETVRRLRREPGRFGGGPRF
ncbi:MAG: ribonuclease H-like domain-containing protein [Planctomycetota bacterium]